MIKASMAKIITSEAEETALSDTVEKHARKGLTSFIEHSLSSKQLQLLKEYGYSVEHKTSTRSPQYTYYLISWEKGSIYDSK